MKKFEFSLERVLRVRQIKENESQQQLKKAQEDKENKKEFLSQLLESHQKYKEEFFNNMDTSMKAGEARIYSTYLPQLTNKIEKQQTRVHEAEKKVDKLFDQWQEAKKEKIVLEKLKERKRVEHKKEQFKVEQKFFDEIARIPKGVNCFD